MSKSLRFVILEHTLPPGHQRAGVHWDWIFELPDPNALLLTFAFPQPPSTQSTVGERLADHRRRYLDYEGPISGGRGEVARWDHGYYDGGWVTEGQHWQARLNGANTQGTLDLVRQPSGESAEPVESADPAESVVPAPWRASLATSLQAVLFDLYGTLLRRPEGPSLFAHVAAHVGAERRRARDVALTTANETLGDFIRRLGGDPPAQLLTWETRLSEELAHIQPYADAVPTLERLRARKLRLGVVSNLASPYKRPFLESSLAPLVDASIMSCDCGYHKPDARIYASALEQLGVAPGAAVMVGDSVQSDVVGAQRAGIQGIHLNRTGTHRERAIRSLGDVVDIVDMLSVGKPPKD